MANRILAQVNAGMVAWPRAAIGMPLSVAAAKIGVSEDRLRAFESGDAKPTIRQLRSIGRVYRRPTAFFYLRTAPPAPDRIEDFRALPDQHDPELPDLLDAVDGAREKRALAIELAGMLGQDVPEFGVHASLQDDPRDVAERIRERLGVEVQTQLSWRDQYRVLRRWTAAAERSGVLVVQFSGVHIAAARGFSIAEIPYPLVALNGTDSPRAKVFTLFHELAHVALGAAGLCDLHEEEHERLAIEPFCNQVAAEALVPSRHLLTDSLVIAHGDVDWEDWRISELATTYGVSSEAMLLRLLTLGRTSQAFYRRKKAEYEEAYERSKQTASGYLQYHRRVLRNNGVEVASLILDAYRADLITPTEVSRYLGGVNLRHIPDIEEAVQAQAG